MDNSPHKKTSSRYQSMQIILIFVILFHFAPSVATSTRNNIKSTDSESLLQLSLATSTHSLSNLSLVLDGLNIPNNDKMLQIAISNCKNLLRIAIYQLKNKYGESYYSSKISKIIANLNDCLDNLERTQSGLHGRAKAAILNSTEHMRNSLEVAKRIMNGMKKNETSNVGLFSSRVMQMGTIDQKPNVTVAKDGSGNVGTIQEAVNLAPDQSLMSFLIYVKEGVYEENVVVDHTKWNVYMIGDGAYKTVVTGNKNAVDFVEIDIRFTATFCAFGQGFVAKDMGFVNTAGPTKLQAVALASSSDQSIFYHCSFTGFQDTLYAHSNRQFYRECDIIGTIDFIFGDATAVFQRCNILPREPLPFQENVIMAQGKDEATENTGFSIHECRITAYDYVTRPTYLARPWRRYSMTVIMRTEITGVVDPAGWMSWDGSVPPETIQFMEFQNSGEGADVSRRVSWASYRAQISEGEAREYMVGAFIDGDNWIPPSGVPFDADL